MIPTGKPLSQKESLSIKHAPAGCGGYSSCVRERVLFKKKEAREGQSLETKRCCEVNSLEPIFLLNSTGQSEKMGQVSLWKLELGISTNFCTRQSIKMEMAIMWKCLYWSRGSVITVFRVMRFIRVILLLSAAAEGGGVHGRSFAPVEYADNVPLRSSVPGGPTEIARVPRHEAVDLVEAAKGNDLLSVKRLLAGGLVHPDEYLCWRWKQPDGFLDHYSDGALMEASRRGHTNTVRLLVDWRCDPDLKSPRGGHTALMLASLHGHKSVVRLLFACGASADVKTVFGASALDYAQRNNHTDVANILLEMGATSEPASSQHLFQAAKAGDAQRVQKLLADGAQPDGYLDCAGNSALMVTVLALLEGRMSDDHDNVELQDQYFDVIHLLLNAGASPDHLGSGRKTQGVLCGYLINRTSAPVQTRCLQ